MAKRSSKVTSPKDEVRESVVDAALEGKDPIEEDHLPDNIEEYYFNVISKMDGDANWAKVFVLMLAVWAQKLTERMKKVGGLHTNVIGWLRFMYTLYCVEGLSEYSTRLDDQFSKWVGYPISDYKIDARLTTLVPSSRVCFPGHEFETLNLLELVRRYIPKGWAIKPYDPQQFATFQVELANLFKSQPNFTQLSEYIKSASISDVESFASGNRCHLEDLSNAQKLPVLINQDVISNAYFQEYFNTNLEYAVRVIIQNTLAKY